MEQKFDTSWGVAVKVLTFIVVLTMLCLLFLCINIQFYFSEFLRLGIIILPLSVLFSLWSRRVKYYKISDDNLIIERWWGRKSIPLSTIKEIQKPFIQFFKLRKVWGNAGVFSYTGTYFYPGLKRFSCYVTNWDNAVFLKLDKGGVMLSPDNEEEFMSKLSTVI